MNTTNTDTAAATRVNAYRFDPDQITIETEARGRSEQQLKEIEAHILSLAASMHPDNGIGQLESITIDQNNCVVYGFSRTGAGRLIKRGFTYEGKVYEPVPDFRLFGQKKTLNAFESLVANITENNHRLAVDPMGTALNIRSLMEDHDQSAEEVASIYRKPTQWVREQLQLIELEPQERKLVSQGKLSVTKALELIELPKAERKEIVAAAGKLNKKETSQLIGEVHRDHILGNTDAPRDEQAESIAQPKKKAKAMTTTQIKQHLVNKDFTDKPNVAAFRDTFIRYMNGEIGDKKMDQAWSKL